VSARMGDLLWMIRWAEIHLGFAARRTLILALRESPVSRIADDRVDRLLARATANGWIEELERPAPAGPFYVLTVEGERALARYEQRLAARGMRRQTS
jgi:uncharacterized protein (DUF3084 family)